MATAKKTTKKRGLDEEIAFAQEVVAAWTQYVADLIAYQNQIATQDGTTPPGGPVNPPGIP